MEMEASSIKEKRKKAPLPPAAKAALGFPIRKAEIMRNLGMSSCDLSPKGTVDIKCLPIIQLLNSHPDYVTTSSCSGRIALFHSIDEERMCPKIINRNGNKGSHVDNSKDDSLKRGAVDAKGWLLVKHGMLLPVEMHLLVEFLCGAPCNSEAEKIDSENLSMAEDIYAARLSDEWYSGELEGVWAPALYNCRQGREHKAEVDVPTIGNVALKMEPFVLHVQCRDVDSSKPLLSAAIGDSGYRNSGMIPPGKKVMCAIRTTTGLGLEVPVVISGVNYVSNQREFLWALLHRANSKMCANEEKIQLLYQSMVKRLAEGSETAQN